MSDLTSTTLWADPTASRDRSVAFWRLRSAEAIHPHDECARETGNWTVGVWAALKQVPPQIEERHANNRGHDEDAEHRRAGGVRTASRYGSIDPAGRAQEGHDHPGVTPPFVKRDASAQADRADSSSQSVAVGAPEECVSEN